MMLLQPFYLSVIFLKDIDFVVLDQVNLIIAKSNLIKGLLGEIEISWNIESLVTALGPFMLIIQSVFEFLQNDLNEVFDRCFIRFCINALNYNCIFLDLFNNNILFFRLPYYVTMFIERVHELLSQIRYLEFLLLMVEILHFYFQALLLE